MKVPKFLIVTCLMSLSIFAQKSTNNIRYHYNLIISTIEKEESQEKTIHMILDILSDNSYFGEKKLIEYQNDIELANNATDNNLYLELLKQAAKKYDKNYYFLIETNKEDNITYEKFNNKKFYITEPRENLKWQIDPESFLWNNLRVQKATTFCDGRSWTVLFTKDIDVKSGPYKFNNLPGFVVKAWDKQNQFIFEYTKNENLVDHYLYLAKPSSYSELTVHEKKVLKEVHYPHLASSKNDSSRNTGTKLHEIENPIDLSFVEDSI